jgi:hypothetical protein
VTVNISVTVDQPKSSQDEGMNHSYRQIKEFTTQGIRSQHLSNRNAGFNPAMVASKDPGLEIILGINEV